MTVKLTAKEAVPHAWANVAISVAIGLILGGVTGLFVSRVAAPLVAWDTVVLVYVVTTWRRVLTFDAQLVKKHALREDPTRVSSDLILVGASIASLAAVALLLVSANGASGPAQAGLAALGVLSVVASWVMIHTLFALRYAEAYYSAPEGGVDFGDAKPIYADFAYLAFTLGMTYQVSDTTLTNRKFRSLALKQSLLSFLLGTVIIATTINLVAGLGK